MGSSGNGMFGTYSGDGAGSISNEGGNSCPSALENIPLENVAISDYFQSYNDVPASGEPVELAMRLINKRLAVVLSSTQEVIGNLPVTYNYLNLCIKKGMFYSGKIKASGLTPIPYIVVNLYA